VRSDPELLAELTAALATRSAPGQDGERPVAALPLPSAALALAPATGAGRCAVAVLRRDDGRLLTQPMLATAAGWRPAAPGDGVSAALLAALGVPVGAGQERTLDIDQTNTSVIVDDVAVVKWIRHPEAGHLPPPAPAHLHALGWPAMPTLFGSVTWEDDGAAPVRVALADRYLPGAEHGWDWATDDAAAGRPLGARLGDLAASLHLALATPSAVIPEPVHRATADDAARWHAAASARLAEAIGLTPGPDGDWLAEHRGELAAALDPIATAAGTPVQYLHGDLHVGQVLRWSGGLAVIDFDGNPVLDPGDRGTRQPPVRDLARLLTSVDHAARIAAKTADLAGRARLAEWSRVEQVALVGHYRRALKAAGRSELFAVDLLPAFGVEQLCRDLIYAGRHLPRWRYAPMGTLRALVDPGAW
jgi:maltokinase